MNIRANNDAVRRTMREQSKRYAMKDYNDWLCEKTGLRCEIRANISFPELADTIRAIVSNIPAYIAEATKAGSGDAKYGHLPSQDCHALILRKLDVLKESFQMPHSSSPYDVELFRSICSELVELAERAEADWQAR